MTRQLLILSIIIAGAIILAAALSGCQTYQPPGEGIWRAL